MSNMSNAMKESAKDARDAVKESGKAASNAGANIQDDLEALRDDVTRLTQQIADIVSAKGSAVWRRAKSNVDGAISDAEAKGKEAVDAVREVSDNMVDAIDESLKRRPYTTLALAVGLGFLFGATWRR